MSKAMDGDAKKELSKAMRGLREELVSTLGNAVEGEYLLSLSVEEAGLPEPRRVRRERLEGWIEEQVRGLPAKQRDTDTKRGELRARFIGEVVKEAAYTWLNRLIVLRLLEANGHTREEVLTGGWSSGAHQRFRKLASVLASGDESEGYGVLLGLVFDELGLSMPGLFGDVGLVKLVPMPPATLRRLVDALNAPELSSCWGDDTTLGWAYQYWNDPEREALDAKLNAGGKLEGHELASKTQLFTEQYMVEWLLQNSLNQMWLGICQQNEWTPECESNGVLERLEARRVEWRARREAEEVSLEELMPIHGEAEEQWKYWVPQPMPDEVVKKAPSSIRDVKLLDPACGSGHFLVGAFGLLMAFHQEEARHRGLEWSKLESAKWILEHNLHGIDIDPRAAQIAAAALMLTARNACGEAVEVERMNLVAPTLRLAGLPEDDPAVLELERSIHAETGLSPELTAGILKALEGADHLGTLLRVDAAINEAITTHFSVAQVGLFEGAPVGLEETSEQLRLTILSHIDTFLAQHANSGDLGLRLRGEQLAAGVRFLELVREGTYDVVVGNPPYQGTSKMKDKTYIKKHYPRGKADLFACFLERGLELVRDGGVSAMVTMRNWMFIKQYQKLREHLLENFDLRTLGDFDRGAFEGIPDEVVSVSLATFWNREPDDLPNIAVQPTSLDDTSRDNMRTPRKRAAVLAHVGRFEFQTKALKEIEGWPLVYWWSFDFLNDYTSSEKLKEKHSVRTGLSTQDNTRYLRRPWEVVGNTIRYSSLDGFRRTWAPIVKGSAGFAWFEPLSSIILWKHSGLHIKCHHEYKYTSISKYVASQDCYFIKGVAISTVGSNFSARIHKYPSVLTNVGTSVYGDRPEYICCLMNRSSSKYIMDSLNPTVHYDVRDVERLPLLEIDSSGVYKNVLRSFEVKERGFEVSVEFENLVSNCWSYAQNWAQRAVDRPEGTPLPEWEPVYEEPTPEQWVSWGVGVSIGRFDRDKGLVDKTPEGALKAGIMYLSEATQQDSLEEEACGLIHEQWEEHGKAINEANSGKKEENLREWLRKRFFDDVHRQMYENAPIYFPLSSSKKSFVAFVNIHQWTSDTLRILQADHLLPDRQRIEGQIGDIRATPEEDRTREDQKQLDRLLGWLEELTAFLSDVEMCAEKGPPAPDAKTPEREVDARYEMVLDDGVMINSAGLWPLLAPQWKYPKKWWKELATAKGRKDYDWSLLAGRYFPNRVDAKCQEDPSLGVAHGCFWKYHPERAYAWELRLQDEIEPGFTIDEADSDACRSAFLSNHPDKAQEIREDELKRRLRAAKKNDEDVDEVELRAQLGLGFGDTE